MRETEKWKPTFVTDQVEANSDGQHLLSIYLNRSIELARQHHPGYDYQQLVWVARQEFDNASQVFWNASLALAKQLRPHGEFAAVGTVDSNLARVLELWYISYNRVTFAFCKAINTRGTSRLMMYGSIIVLTTLTRSTHTVRARA